MSDCRIWVGTSGYSYSEWSDAGFYPPGIRPGEMMCRYARIFPITELNYTWYQMPRAEAMERMVSQAPAGFLFTAKLTRTLTHEIDADGWRSQVGRYRDGISPVYQSKRLVAILAQFPPFFKRVKENRRYLADLLDALSGMPLAVEFRHASWASDKVFSELQRRKICLVSIDRPDLPGLFPTLDVVTDPDLFYIRFHGRNLRGWRSGNMQKQFDYRYSESELIDWTQNRIEKMTRQAGRGVVFFNNHVRAQAPENAQTLMRLLSSFGMGVQQPVNESKSWTDPLFT